MFLLNLSLAQFLMVMGTVSGMVVALYLLDRSRRKQVVATLRFWVASEMAAETRRRKRIQQPFSLILQLLSIALLLLALAQLRLGSHGPQPRDHVLILDTSAWMAAASEQGTLMDEARREARRYLNSLPAGDRVMLVRADALATPAIVFESNRAIVERAIAESQPGATALNLAQAFEFARQAQRLQGGRAGEIVFAGAGRVGESDVHAGAPGLRTLAVGGGVQNSGLRRIGLRRSASEPDTWEVMVAVRNYGAEPRTTPLVVQFGGAAVHSSQLTLPAGAERSVSFQFKTRVPGLLEARLLDRDGFAGDDRAVLELPGTKRLRLAVYSNEPELLKPVLAANPYLEPVFRTPAEYGTGPADADMVVLDRFAPAQPPSVNAIWIEPPADRSPVRIVQTVSDVRLASWRSDHALGSGLRVQDLKLESAEVFAAAPGDVRVAEVERGPVILARSGKTKTVVLGFHPVRSAMRYELATPLLFANILRWMSPDVFRRWELNAGSVGTVNVPLGPDSDPAAVRVLSESGADLPHTAEAGSVRFFAGSQGTVRVTSGSDEIVYSLTLPEMAEARWEPPPKTLRGVPPPSPSPMAYIELWHVLAFLGGLGLLTEWLLYGRPRTLRAAHARRG